MRIHSSDELTKLTHRKVDAGCRSLLCGIADSHYRSVGDRTMAAFIGGLEIAFGMSGYDGDITVIPLTPGGGALVFRGDLLSTTKKVEGVESPKVGKTPDRVLRKMFYSRLKNFMSELHALNLNRKRSYEHLISMNMGNLTKYNALTPAEKKWYEQIHVPEDVRTRAGIETLIAALPNYSRSKRSLEKVLAREDMTDEIVSASWDMHLAGTIQDV